MTAYVWPSLLAAAAASAPCAKKPFTASHPDASLLPPPSRSFLANVGQASSHVRGLMAKHQQARVEAARRAAEAAAAASAPPSAGPSPMRRIGSRLSGRFSGASPHMTHSQSAPGLPYVTGGPGSAAGSAPHSPALQSTSVGASMGGAAGEHGEGSQLVSVCSSSILHSPSSVSSPEKGPGDVDPRQQQANGSHAAEQAHRNASSDGGAGRKGPSIGVEVEVRQGPEAEAGGDEVSPTGSSPRRRLAGALPTPLALALSPLQHSGDQPDRTQQQRRQKQQGKGSGPSVNSKSSSSARSSVGSSSASTRGSSGQAAGRHSQQQQQQQQQQQTAGGADEGLDALPLRPRDLARELDGAAGAVSAESKGSRTTHPLVAGAPLGAGAAWAPSLPLPGGASAAGGSGGGIVAPTKSAVLPLPSPFMLGMPAAHGTGGGHGDGVERKEPADGGQGEGSMGGAHAEADNAVGRAATGAEGHEDRSDGDEEEEAEDEDQEEDQGGVPTLLLQLLQQEREQGVLDGHSADPDAKVHAADGASANGLPACGAPCAGPQRAEEQGRGDEGRGTAAVCVGGGSAEAVAEVQGGADASAAGPEEQQQQQQEEELEDDGMVVPLPGHLVLDLDLVWRLPRREWKRATGGCAGQRAWGITLSAESECQFPWS